MNRTQEMQNLGKVFKRLRQEKGLIQADIGRQLGTGTPGYHKIEIGERDIPLSRLFQLADVFKTDVNEIINLARHGEAYVIRQKRCDHGFMDALRFKNQQIILLQKKLIDYYEAIGSLELEEGLANIPLWDDEDNLWPVRVYYTDIGENGQLHLSCSIDPDERPLPAWFFMEHFYLELAEDAYSGNLRVTCTVPEVVIFRRKEILDFLKLAFFITTLRGLNKELKNIEFILVENSVFSKTSENMKPSDDTDNDLDS